MIEWEVATEISTRLQTQSKSFTQCSKQESNAGWTRKNNHLASLRRSFHLHSHEISMSDRISTSTEVESENRQSAIGAFLRGLDEWTHLLEKPSIGDGHFEANLIANQ